VDTKRFPKAWLVDFDGTIGDVLVDYVALRTALVRQGHDLRAGLLAAMKRDADVRAVVDQAEHEAGCSVRTDALHLLRDLHGQVVVVTNNLQDVISSALENEWPVVGRTACGPLTTKPDPEVYLRGARTAKTAPADCVMISDQQYDIEGARRVGIAGLYAPNGLRINPYKMLRAGSVD